MWTHGVDISHVLVLTNVALICDHDGDDFKAYQMGTIPSLLVVERSTPRNIFANSG